MKIEFRTIIISNPPKSVVKECVDHENDGKPVIDYMIAESEPHFD